MLLLSSFVAPSANTAPARDGRPAANGDARALVPPRRRLAALVAPRWPMLPGSTGTSQGFAVAAAVLSVGGSVHTQSVLPAVYGLLYAACFTLAMRGVSSPLQLVLVFAMVGLSFALHMVFLPAGYTAQSTHAQQATGG